MINGMDLQNKDVVLFRDYTTGIVIDDCIFHQDFFPFDLNRCGWSNITDYYKDYKFVGIENRSSFDMVEVLRWCGNKWKTVYREPFDDTDLNKNLEEE